MVQCVKVLMTSLTTFDALTCDCTHLVWAHGHGLPQQQPHDALFTGRRGEGAMVGPVVPASRKQARWVEVSERSLLALEDQSTLRGHVHSAPPRGFTYSFMWRDFTSEKESCHLNRFRPFTSKPQMTRILLYVLTRSVRVTAVFYSLFLWSVGLRFCAFSQGLLGMKNTSWKLIWRLQYISCSEYLLRLVSTLKKCYLE